MDNVELVRMGTSDDTLANTFWRFYPAFLENDVIMISRDTDSRLNMREKIAVDEWLASDKDFHIMRDHCCHRMRILAGMWGSKNNVLNPLAGALFNYIKPNVKFYDQIFLQDVVYPVIKNNCIIHDSQQFYSDEKSHKFTTDADYFVGDCILTADHAFKSLNKTEHQLAR